MYYIKGADKVYGCSEEMLHTLLEKGRITLDAPVSTDQKTWQPLRTIPGFSSLAAAQDTSGAAHSSTSGTSSNGGESADNLSRTPSFGSLQNNNSSTSTDALSNSYSQQQYSTPQTQGRSATAQQADFPPVQDERWFLSNDGVNGFGPYPTNQVVAMIQNGQVYPNNFAWRNGENPVPIASIPLFANYFNFGPSNFNAPMQYYRAPMPNYNAPMPNHGYGYPVSSCSRTTYILLGLFFGGFGVHNFYAGYSGRGAIQLIFTLCIIGWFFVPLWALIEICTVTTDANGIPFS